MHRAMHLVAILAAMSVVTTVAIGHGVVLPALATQPLLDANLATAVAQPVALRLGEVAVAAAAVTLLAAARIRREWATALAVGLLLVVAIHRGWVLPRCQAAWDQVDQVAGRPADRKARAESWSDWDAALLWLAAGLGGAVVGTLAVANRPNYAPLAHSATGSRPGQHREAEAQG